MTVSVKDKLDLSISVAVGSSIVRPLQSVLCASSDSMHLLQQIALFVTPYVPWRCPSLRILFIILLQVNGYFGMDIEQGSWPSR